MFIIWNVVKFEWKDKAFGKHFQVSFFSGRCEEKTGEVDKQDNTQSRFCHKQMFKTQGSTMRKKK